MWLVSRGGPGRSGNASGDRRRKRIQLDRVLDGQQIAYIAGPEGVIVSVDPNGQNRRIIAKRREAGFFLFLSWSRSPDRMAAVVESDVGMSLVIVELLGSRTGLSDHFVLGRSRAARLELRWRSHLRAWARLAERRNDDAGVVFRCAQWSAPAADGEFRTVLAVDPVGDRQRHARREHSGRGHDPVDRRYLGPVTCRSIDSRRRHELACMGRHADRDRLQQYQPDDRA